MIPLDFDLLADDLRAIDRLEDLQDKVKKTVRAVADAQGATFVLLDGECCYYADEDSMSPLWSTPSSESPARNGFACTGSPGHRSHSAGRRHSRCGLSRRSTGPVSSHTLLRWENRGGIRGSSGCCASRLLTVRPAVGRSPTAAPEPALRRGRRATACLW